MLFDFRWKKHVVPGNSRRGGAGVPPCPSFLYGPGSVPYKAEN